MRSATRKRTGVDEDYKAWIRSLPCVACTAARGGNGSVESVFSPIEAAHVGERGLSQKCPDRETIPLCVRHHREGTYSLHKLGKNWWTLHGIDKTALIAELQDRYEKETRNGCS